MKGYTDVTEFTTAIPEEAEAALVTEPAFSLGAPEMSACLMRQI